MATWGPWRGYLGAAAGWARRAPAVWRWSFGLFVAQQIGAVLNMVTSLFVLPALLTPDDLGAVDPLMRFIGVGGIPLAVLGYVGVKYLSRFQARGEIGKIKLFLRDMSLLALFFSVGLSVALLFFYPSISLRMHVTGSAILAGMLGLLIVSCWQPVLSVMLQGTQRFLATMVTSFVHPALTLAGVLVWVPASGLSGYLGARFVAGLAPVVISLAGLRHFIHRRVALQSYYDERRALLRFAWPVTLMVAAAWLNNFIEPLVVRHWLPRMDSAGFYMAYRLGSIPAVLLGSIVFVLFPMLSHRHERGEPTGRLFGQAWWGTCLIGFLSALVLGLGAGRLMSAVGPWREYTAYARWVGPIGAVVVMDALNATYTSHELARRRFSFLWIIIPVQVLQSVFLYGVFGWGALAGRIPQPLWDWVDQRVPRSLGLVIGTMVLARSLATLCLLAHWRRSDSGNQGLRT